MDIPDIKAALADFDAGALLTTAERLTGGVSADVFRLDVVRSDGELQSLVLRARRRHGMDASLEYALLAALHGHRLPVPRPLHLGSGRDGALRPHLLVEYVAGSSDIPEDRLQHCVASMAEVLAQIHSFPLALLPALPNRVDISPSLFSGMNDSDLRQDECDLCCAAAANTRACPEVLLHGDFWPKNLLWRAGRIAAVIDWEDAATGDPMFDLACALLELRFLYDEAIVQRFCDAYAASRAIDPLRLALWQVYAAAATQRSMGGWGLEPSREAHMRQTAQRQIRAAAAFLKSQTPT